MKKNALTEIAVHAHCTQSFIGCRPVFIVFLWTTWISNLINVTLQSLFLYYMWSVFLFFIRVYVRDEGCDLCSGVSDFFIFTHRHPLWLFSLKWIHFSRSSRWIISHVHIVCDYCSVTPDADPGLCAVPECRMNVEECRHILSHQILLFQRTTLIVSLFKSSVLQHWGIMLHHSETTATIIIVIIFILSVFEW